MERKMIEIDPEEQERKDAWLRKLAEFIVEANLATWAGEGKSVPAERPGYYELEHKNKDFRYRDSFTGWYRAPGTTTIYYKEKPVWVMQYGGHGMTNGYEHLSGETFEFLKAALRLVSTDLPYRGPKEHVVGNQKYEFELIDGDIADCEWREKITEDGVVTFTQKGTCGIVVHQDENKQPIMPWNL